MKNPKGPTAELLSSIGLVDHHVHATFREGPSKAMFTKMMTESDRVPRTLSEGMFSQVGFAIRTWAAPILGLAPHVDDESYWQKREEIGGVEVGKRLLQASGIEHFIIDTGYKGSELNTNDEMRALTGKRVDSIIRLETVAEQVATSGVSAANFPTHFTEALRRETQGALGLKSIAAYRIGLDFDPSRPTEKEVALAASTWFKEIESTGIARVSDPVLIRFLIWHAVDLNLPLQFHIGYGDPDLDLLKCDPLHLTALIRAFETHEVPILLLHCYPFQRNAGYLAQMFRNVFLDVGLAINYTGARSNAIIAETLELAPFNKVLFSSDAWGLPELTFLGSLLFRRGMAEILDGFIADGDWSIQDAERVIKAIAQDNARIAYQIQK